MAFSMNRSSATSVEMRLLKLKLHVDVCVSWNVSPGNIHVHERD